MKVMALTFAIYESGTTRRGSASPEPPEIGRSLVVLQLRPVNGVEKSVRITDNRSTLSVSRSGGAGTAEVWGDKVSGIPAQKCYRPTQRAQSVQKKRRRSFRVRLSSESAVYCFNMVHSVVSEVKTNTKNASVVR